MNRKVIYEIKGMYRDDFRITGFEFGQGEKAVCIVGSSRGNEVQQIYCCAQLVKKMKQLEEEGRIYDGYKMLIIPSINPYSMNIQKRFWSTDNTDINRMFPGYNLGETTQRIADGVFREIKDYKYGIQFTSFYMPGDFVPQATLNYNWQVWDTSAFSLYTNTTSSISSTGAGQAVLSVMNFMSNNGMIKYGAIGEKNIRTIQDTEFISVRTAKSGLFEPLVQAGEKVNAGKPLAHIIDPYEGFLTETLYAPVNGVVFFIHNEPLTYANTAVIKILGDE